MTVKNLLVIDIGNTQTVFGVYDEENLVGHWRVSTDPTKTADEFAVFLRNFLGEIGMGLEDSRGLCVASGVPSMQAVIEEVADKHMEVRPLFVGAGVKTGIRIQYRNPHEVGADRIANSVAAFQAYKTACVVVDFGTAVTFDPITSGGEYLGGVIFPGLSVGADALYRRTARLPHVAFTKPETVIGKDTISAIQSGLIFGYADMVDAMVARIAGEMGEQPKVIGTGGLIDSVAGLAKSIEEIDPWLTLKGLRLIYGMNRP